MYTCSRFIINAELTQLPPRGQRLVKNESHTFEFRNYLDLFCAPISSELVKAIHSSVQFQIKEQKISRRRLRSPNM